MAVNLIRFLNGMDNSGLPPIRAWTVTFGKLNVLVFSSHAWKAEQRVRELYSLGPEQLLVITEVETPEGRVWALKPSDNSGKIVPVG